MSSASTWLRKKLQGNPELNPFNKEYTIDKLNKFLEENEDKYKEDKYSLSIAQNSKYYNTYYKQVMSYIEEKVNKIDNDELGIIQTILAIVNREFYLSRRLVMESSSSVNSIEKMEYFETDSLLNHFGKMNVGGVVEISVDILNILSNIFKYKFKISKNQTICNCGNSLNEVVKLYRLVNVWCCVKSTYDKALWENGYINKKNNDLHVKYMNEEYPIARKIGDIRINNNILGSTMIVEELNKKYNFRNSNIKNVIVEKVEIDDNGYLKYTLKNGSSDIDNNFEYTMAEMSIMLYYPFITEKKFENINNLNIFDLLILFFKLSELINKINFNYIEDKECENLNNFFYRMKRKQLLQYLKDTTNYNKKQIENFLTLLESNFDCSKRINFWSKPILKAEDIFYFLSANIISPNINFLVDEWLDNIGYDMKERGTEFEKYIKKKLSGGLYEKSYFFKIPDKSKFYINRTQFEEIDLIVNLKNILIVAEVKCIKYPLESIEVYNNYKILHKASEQVKRKAEYIYNNRINFIEDIGNIENKKIVKVIITNYPILAGTMINDVPVIDYYLFESYTINGVLTDYKTYFSDNNIHNDSVNEIKYYSNEDEYCTNIEDFINNPPSINRYRKKMRIKSKEVTLSSATIHIYQDFVDLIDNN